MSLTTGTSHNSSLEVSGGEQTRIADFYVANAESADFGELRRTETAGQEVVHASADRAGFRRPRDGRAMAVRSHVGRQPA